MRSFCFFTSFCRCKEVFYIKRFIPKPKNTPRALRISPLLLISGISFALAVLFLIYPHNIFQPIPYHSKPRAVKGISLLKPTAIPTNTPTPTIVYRKLLQISPTPQPTLTQQIATQTQQATPTVVKPTSAPTQTPTQIVNMQIIEPDGTSSFSVKLNAGNNLCDNLNEARTEGKIKSVTMTWYSSFNSYYINEINGFSNNWTVTTNGTQTKVGCSLIKPNPNDTIVWKFG